MGSFYDYRLFQQEIFFDELQVGQSFPAFRYRLGPEHIDAYLRSVSADVSSFHSEENARDTASEGVVVPTLMALNYGYVYSAMARRPPSGFLNSSVSYEFNGPVYANSELVMKISIAAKEIRRGKKYVILRADVHNPLGHPVCSADISCVFPM